MNAKDVEDMLKKYKLWLERKTFLLQWRTTLEPQNSMIAVREPEKNVIKRRIIDEEIEEKNVPAEKWGKSILQKLNMDADSLLKKCMELNTSKSSES